MKAARTILVLAACVSVGAALRSNAFTAPSPTRERAPLPPTYYDLEAYQAFRNDRPDTIRAAPQIISLAMARWTLAPVRLVSD